MRSESWLIPYQPTAVATVHSSQLSPVSSCALFWSMPPSPLEQNCFLLAAQPQMQAEETLRSAMCCRSRSNSHSFFFLRVFLSLIYSCKLHIFQLSRLPSPIHFSSLFITSDSVRCSPHGKDKAGAAVLLPAPGIKHRLCVQREQTWPVCITDCWSLVGENRSPLVLYLAGVPVITVASQLILEQTNDSSELFSLQFSSQHPLLFCVCVCFFYLCVAIHVLNVYVSLQEPRRADWPLCSWLPRSRPTQGGHRWGWGGAAQLCRPLCLLQKVHDAVLPAEHRGANDRPHHHLPEVLERVRLEDPFWELAQVRWRQLTSRCLSTNTHCWRGLTHSEEKSSKIARMVTFPAAAECLHATGLIKSK